MIRRIVDGETIPLQFVPLSTILERKRNDGTGTMGVQLTASEALGLWHRVLSAQVRDDVPDLTVRQMAILLQIYLEPPPHTVRGLAALLEVTKPVITRALDRMGEFGLVDRHRDPRDMRNVVIKRTVKGALFLEKFGDLVIAEAGALA